MSQTRRGVAFRTADLAPGRSVLAAWEAVCARFGHSALVLVMVLQGEEP
jgi:hypothetical protein